MNSKADKIFRKIASFVGLLFLIVIFLNIILSALPGWQWRNGDVKKASVFAVTVSILGLLIVIMIKIRVPPGITFLIAACILPVALIFYWITLNPLDTHTEPYDKKVLTMYPNGKKLVEREYKSSKSNAPITDTILAKDFLLFRRIYSRKIVQE